MDNLFLAYALIVLGLLLLAAELLLPTGGVLFVLAVAALVAGVAMTFYHSAANGVVTLVAIFIIVSVMGPVLVHYWPKTAMGKKFFPAAEEDATVANMPVNLELEQLRGRYGKTISALRPAGLVDFHGKRIDTMSDGDLIDPGQWVRCIDVKAGKVLVRRVDRPPELGDIDPDDLKNL